LESLELDAIAQALRVHALAIHASTMIQFWVCEEVMQSGPTYQRWRTWRWRQLSDDFQHSMELQSSCVYCVLHQWKTCSGLKRERNEFCWICPADSEDWSNSALDFELNNSASMRLHYQWNQPWNQMEIWTRGMLEND
jgi:hypothetical protein